MYEHELCCAVATAPGSGGISIVRMSGEGAEEVLRAVFVPVRRCDAFESHRMMYGTVTAENGEVIDEVMAVLMRAPNSYTREDVAEIQCHGGDVCAQRVLARLLACGARPAQPGEFTKRAFLNGRIDLSRAEAVMELIGAQSEAAARAGVRQLEGGVSGFVRGVSAELVRILAAIEAATDFPDEIEEETAADEVCAALEALHADIARRCDPDSLRLMREGASVVLAGRPNVGKSSLMNALLRQERAIVTAIPGTTRDVLTERIRLGGIAAQLTDTAGLRETDDVVEKIGVDRARSAADSADVVLIVLDAGAPLTAEDRALLAQADARAIVLINKTDAEEVLEAGEIAVTVPVLRVSARSGDGIPELMALLTERMRAHCGADSLTVERHIRIATGANAHIAAAMDAVRGGLPLDMAAIDLRAALKEIYAITAADAGEDVIEEIFAKFCVGK